MTHSGVRQTTAEIDLTLRKAQRPVPITHDARSIVSAEHIASVPVRCVQVSGKSRLYTMADGDMSPPPNAAALMKQHLLNDVQKQLAQLQREDVHKFLGRLQQEQSNMYKKVVSVSTVATDLERLERNLRSNMSTHVLDMLGHSHRGIQ